MEFMSQYLSYFYDNMSYYLTACISFYREKVKLFAWSMVLWTICSSITWYVFLCIIVLCDQSHCFTSVLQASTMMTRQTNTAHRWSRRSIAYRSDRRTSGSGASFAATSWWWNTTTYLTISGSGLMTYVLMFPPTF